ncbi:hypothetical protein TWF730_006585 [Orbilia blumenaviensis]|uniref:Uncharacterized protein n=1 Tax=Orbilia blumenaviensis TaxID=1796055 RepID=A0AAV9VI57_9PEZI
MTTATITITPHSTKSTTTDSGNSNSRLTILRSTSERKTLNSLVRASALFKTAYEDGMIFEDASKYKEEAYFIAYFADSFSKKPRTLSDLDVVLLSYPSAKVAGGRPGSSSSSSSSSCFGQRDAPSHTSTPWYHARILNGPAEFSERVVANHKAIVAISQLFISRMKYPSLIVNNATDKTEAAELKQKYLREGTPATDTEKEKIIRGFYRLWLLSLVYGANTVPEDGDENVDTDYGRMMACYRCLGGLKYWDVKVVQLLLAFLLKELKPMFWYYKKIESVVNKDVLKDDIPEAAAEDIYTNYYFTAFMATEFPHNAASWLTHSIKPLLMSERFLTLSSIIKSTALKVPYEEYFSLFFPKDVLRWNTGEFQGPRPVISGKEFSENVPLKPLCRVAGDGLSQKLADTATSAVKKSTWLMVELGKQDSTETDFWGAVWDDERLRGWGYCIPKFEEDNLGKKAWKGHLRRLSSRWKLH